jgi:hypothetical protein
MAQVVRLLSVADVREEADPRRMSVAVRLEAVLDDGRHVVLLDGRGWSEELRGAGARDGGDAWALASREEVIETARTVVGPDEPFGERSQADMERDHWSTLASTLARHRVGVDARRLAAVPHDVVLSEALLARLNRGLG